MPPLKNQTFAGIPIGKNRLNQHLFNQAYVLVLLSKKYTKGFLAMKTLFFCVSVVAAITGCASPSGDMLNNKFLVTKPTPPAKELIGFWTGAQGPFIVTIKLDESGNGIYCADTQTKSVSRMIHNNGSLIMESGLKQSISKEGDKIVLSTDYLAGYKSDFYSDNHLEKSTFLCRDYFKNFKVSN